MASDLLAKIKADKDTQDDPNFEVDLLAAAEMYKLEGLKRMCEVKLCDQLEVNNVLQSLAAGDTYRAFELKGKALKLIAEKRKEIEKLKDWDEFAEKYPKLTVEIIKMLCE